MSFNDDANLDTSGVQRRGGGRGIAIGGGSAVVLIIAFVASQFLGVDLTGLVSGVVDNGSQSSQSDPSSLEQCKTGADANKNVDCRMVGAQNSLDAYWSAQAPQLGIRYRTPGFVLYDGQTSSGCGTASNSVGPFYCPGDQTMYIDPSFFTLMERQLGAEDGPLAELYIVGHEWGHHIQNELGVFDRIDQRATGPASDGVRSELQADCYAGSWIASASQTTDKQGTALLKPPTQSQISNALGAASAVGDDHIQSQSGRGVHPESFTHGTSEQRTRWFTTGLQQGWQACDTFKVSASKL